MLKDAIYGIAVGVKIHSFSVIRQFVLPVTIGVVSNAFIAQSHDYLVIE